MADSFHTRAQSSASPAPLDPASADDPGGALSAPGSSKLTHLVARAADGFENLHDVQLAYAGLEMLISPVCGHESGEVHASRGELAALLRMLNEGLDRRVEAIDLAVQTLRDAMRERGRAQLDEGPEPEIEDELEDEATR